MLALVYKIIFAYVSFIRIKGRKVDSPDFMSCVMGLVAYQFLFVVLVIWLYFLIRYSPVSLWDVPSILGLVAAQEATIDVIVVTVSKKLSKLLASDDQETSV